MAGETTGTTKATRAARLSKGTPKVLTETIALLATETELADNILFRNIRIPSNAIISEIAVYNDDLDSNGTPALVLDMGLAAGEDFTSTTGGTETKHSEDDILDADAYVDGSTVGQAATTSWTVQAFDATTFGPDDVEKAAWEVLGYDEDPKTTLVLSMTAQVAAATGAAGDLAARVTILVD